MDSVHPSPPKYLDQMSQQCMNSGMAYTDDRRWMAPMEVTPIPGQVPGQ